MARVQSTDATLNRFSEQAGENYKDLFGKPQPQQTNNRPFASSETLKLQTRLSNMSSKSWIGLFEDTPEIRTHFVRSHGMLAVIDLLQQFQRSRDLISLLLRTINLVGVLRPDLTQHQPILLNLGPKGIWDISHAPKLLVLHPILRDWGVGLTTSAHLNKTVDDDGQGTIPQHQFCLQ
ncbi:hypothetical protein PtA15_15A363 [Puccinia triticina]|uniref:Uncharacterized protein n=1 Tax=Puccinia triticina TaxID=208348 RepID=A0ABY7D7I6_9BASI|nr:uncharacterized protein PtA15_15A363 [Puccinia triticina]WAQ91970.1 hypothetical protein PtA15_15A363 [Puccinia triticina]